MKKKKPKKPRDFGESICRYKTGMQSLSPANSKRKKYERQKFIEKLNGFAKRHKLNTGKQRIRAKTRVESLCTAFLGGLVKRFPGLNQLFTVSSIEFNPRKLPVLSRARLYVNKYQKPALIKELQQTGLDLSLMNRIALFSEILFNSNKQVGSIAERFEANPDRNFLLKHFFLSDYLQIIYSESQKQLEKMLRKIR